MLSGLLIVDSEKIPIINTLTQRYWCEKSKTIPAVESNNRILSENVQIDIDTRTGKINANTICIGSPGSRKTTSIVYTNCMQLGGSKVICDPKAETTYRLAGFFENAGYKVKILDLMNMDESECFNPFRYVEEDEDIPKMVSFCFRGFDAGKAEGGAPGGLDDADPGAARTPGIPPRRGEV